MAAVEAAARRSIELGASDAQSGDNCSRAASTDPITLALHGAYAVFCTIDDKRIPLYRILWISDLPHFCGNGECEREGQYEIRLEQNETIWANLQEHDAAIEALGTWLKHSRGAKNDPLE